MASTKKTKKKDPNARLVLPLPASAQPATVVSTCLQQVTTVQANPDLVNHPEVKAAAATLQTQAQAAGQTVSELANARSLVTTLETKRNQEVHDLRQVHTNLEALLNIAAGGDPAKVVAWGGKVATRVTTQPSEDPPVNPTATTTPTMGTIQAKCKAEPGAVCYLMQLGTDPAHPEAWPAPAISSGARHAFSGLTVGQKVYVRIAVVRRGNVQGRWSSVLDVIVR